MSASNGGRFNQRLAFSPVREILSDLVAEEQSLDQFLQRINPRDWKRTKVWHGWTVQEVVSHLASTEEYAFDALSAGGGRLKELATFGSMDALNAAGIKPGDGMRPQDVIERWRGARAKDVEELSRLEAADRVPWFHGDMSARSFATARLMESWAHGLDLYEAVDAEVEDTPRIRHIAWLAWRSLPHVFREAGEDYPTEVRVELMAPGYAKWVFGPEDSDNVIKGQAGEWCRVAVGRLNLEDAGTLKAQGPLAERALELVRAHL